MSIQTRQVSGDGTGANSINGEQGDIVITSDDSSLTVDTTPGKIDLSVTADLVGVNTLNTEQGDITLASADSSVTVTTSTGNVDLAVDTGVESINGEDDAVTIASADASVTVTTSTGNVDLAVDTGVESINGEDDAVTIASADASVTVTTSTGNVDLAVDTGVESINGEDDAVTIASADSSVTVTTSTGNVDLAVDTGVESINGEDDAVTIASADSSVTVTTSTGNVDLAVDTGVDSINNQVDDVTVVSNDSSITVTTTAGQIDLSVATPGQANVQVGTTAPTTVNGTVLWNNTNAGKEGIYFRDQTRNKWLESGSPIVLQFGRDNVNNAYMNPAGINFPGVLTGYNFIDQLTIIGFQVAARRFQGATTSGTVRIRADGVNVGPAFTVTSTGGNVPAFFQDMTLNLDLANLLTGRKISVFVESNPTALLDVTAAIFLRRRG